MCQYCFPFIYNFDKTTNISAILNVEIKTRKDIYREYRDYIFIKIGTITYITFAHVTSLSTKKTEKCGIKFLRHQNNKIRKQRNREFLKFRKSHFE